MLSSAEHHRSSRTQSRAKLLLALFGLLAAQASAQAANTSPPKPAFEALSIRQVEKTRSTRTSSGLVTITTPTKPCEYRADRIICQLSLRLLMQEAFQLKKQELPDFPGIDDHLFLIQGLIPANTDKAAARLMLQGALEDRFDLKFHREIRTIPAYALIEGKHGARLQPAEDPAHRKLLNVVIPTGGHGAQVTMSAGQFSAVAMSLDILADFLNTLADMDHPVINMTGMTGEYKIDLHWTPQEDEQSTSIKFLDSGFPNAVQEQLGLKLEKRQLLSNVFVIDHVNPLPTEN